VGAPEQSLSTGQLQARFEQELQFYLSLNVVTRLWNKDLSLWPSELVEEDETLAKLHWVSLPETISTFLAQVRTILGGTDADGLTDHVVISSEGVNLCARALMELVGLPLARKVVILDSISPEAILQAENQLDLSRTVVFLANKEQYGLKDHCLFLYFQDLLRSSVGNNSAKHFVAETEAHSYLAGISRGHGFRDAVTDPPSIPETFFSLIHFGAALTALGLADPEQILAAVAKVRTACGDTSPANPALQIAAFLSATVADRCCYLGLLASPSLQAYARRLGQMIGGSLAQRKPGLFPLVGMNFRDLSAVENDAAFVALSYAADDSDDLRGAIHLLQSHGTPILHIQIAQPLELLTESFLWETALILASVRLQLNPFHLADNRIPLAFSGEILDAITRGEDPLRRSPRLADKLIQLYADGVTRQEISSLNFVEALRSFLRIWTPARHVTLLVDLPHEPEVLSHFAALRSMLSEVLQRPVAMVFGPHAGEHTVYFFRESRPHGLTLIFTTDLLTDKPIPGARYTFGQFYQALCLSEYDTLVHWQRPVLRLHLSREFPAALQQLLHAFTQALHRFHD
jgi:transaldolase / glucose-6-phosphate isomerase